MSMESYLPDDLARLLPDWAGGWTPTVALPSGRLVTGRTPMRSVLDEWDGDWNFERRGMVGPPVCWVTDGPVPMGLWSRLRAEHRRSGLWPLLLLDGVGHGEFGWFCEDESSMEQLDATTLLRGWWDCYDRGFLTSSERRTLGLESSRWPGANRNAPWWPGIAPAGEARADPDVVADQLAEATLAKDPSARLALVAATRSADSVAFAGWPVTDDDSRFTGALSTVVRSWETRFGARVFGVERGTLWLSVAAPPTTLDHAMHVAVEHFAFCPEVETRDDFAFDSTRPHFTQYAESIVDQSSWSFWWD